MKNEMTRGLHRFVRHQTTKTVVRSKDFIVEAMGAVRAPGRNLLLGPPLSRFHSGLDRILHYTTLLGRRARPLSLGLTSFDLRVMMRANS